MRGDSGFCRNELMSWCEANQVDYVFGVAPNQRLRRIIGPQMWEATQQWDTTGKPARVFTEFAYQTKKRKNGGWERERRGGGEGGGASVVRRAVRRARGDGEPDQGAVQSVCRSGQQRDDASQSDAHVLFHDGLRAGVRLAPVGAEGHGDGNGASGHDSHTVAQDRRPGARECTASLPGTGGELPMGDFV